MILAYETSTKICSVSFQNSKGKTYEKRIEGRSVHSDHVFLFTQELMTEHDFKIEDLNAVLVSNGPGSYTGLRIAASALKGFLFGAEVDLYEVNTLASLAMIGDLKEKSKIHSVIDARRTHVYYQQFEWDGSLKASTDPEIKEISEVEKILNPGEIISGNAIHRFDKKALSGLRTRNEDHISASSLIKLFELDSEQDFCKKVTAEELNPNYISSSQINNSSG